MDLTGQSGALGADKNREAGGDSHRSGRRKLLLAGLALPLVLAGCKTSAPPSGFPTLGFAHLTPLKLRVSSVTVERHDSGGDLPGRVDLQFPQPLGDLAALWGRERLKAVGGTSRLIYRVTEASVLETKLKRTQGVSGYFTTDQTERYDASVKAEVRVIDELGQQVAQTQVSVQRSSTVPEDASLRRREEIWVSLSEDIMTDFNREMEGAIGKYLFPYRVL
ncbi:hypothetical protein ACTL6U_14160 [Rhodovibrionaceae bacterium A322]